MFGIVDALLVDMDPDGSGTVDEAEFCEHGGLAECVGANIQQLSPHRVPQDFNENFEGFELYGEAKVSGCK